MSGTKKPKPPTHLGPEGKGLWTDVVDKYDLRTDEQRTLMFACRALDLAFRFDAEWELLGCPMMSKGSTGQDVEHPLIGSADKQRKASQSFMAALKLPDDADGEGAASNQHRSAAQSRWASRGATG